MGLSKWKFGRNKGPTAITAFPLAAADCSQLIPRLSAVKGYVNSTLEVSSKLQQAVVSNFSSPSLPSMLVYTQQPPVSVSEVSFFDSPKRKSANNGPEVDQAWASYRSQASQDLSDATLTNKASIAFEKEIHELVGTKDIHFEMTSDGCGGAYFIRNGQKEVIGIFKPRDEEYMGPNNPRGYAVESAVVGVSDHPTNPGFRVGNGALRERAAFLLDELYGNFSAVPETTVMALSADGKEPKMGSVQRFVASQSSAEDMGTLKFAIPEVHKIGILDLRLFNTDRHAGNILLSDADGASKENQLLQMTPIDHGFCLPSYKNLDGATFDWLNWSQAQFPFTSEELDHISSLNPDRDAVVLRSLGIEEECVTTMRISTRFLQIGAEAGFSLGAIGACVQREGDFSKPSVLEEMVEMAMEDVKMDGLCDQDDAAFHDALVSKMESAAREYFDTKPMKRARSISCFTYR